ncbi:uncharacterized protein LOC110371689 [Helicoverpa armigera]|uniref:uncharacterized protein LOC110371689 n=1 Tax=Helicoverpa armigera TaxID=29058 RepID=UPI003082EAD3
MSPKKTVQKPNLKRKNAEKATPKQTIRKRTLKSNQPVNFKVSIPLAETTDDGVFVPVVKGRRPPQFKKNLDVNTKVELANSVARQQLSKNDVAHPVFEPDNVVYIQAPKVRRRTFKNKVISDFFEKRIVLEKKSEETVTSTATKTPVKDAPKVSERPRRIVTRKRLADSTAQLDAKQPREDTDTEMAPLNVNIKVENIQGPEDEVETNSHFVTQPADEEPLTSEGKTLPVANNKKCPIKRPRPASKKPTTTKRSVGRKKQTPQGKQETVTVDSNPSIVDQLRKPKKPNVEIKIGPKPGASARVNSNRSSVSSNSNWSCTTTCVTVSPTDFVHLNKKVPVLVLTNIDNEVKKRQIDAQKNTVSNDAREVEESSDSTDSESQSSDSEDSDDMSEQELINRNSLDLSDSPEFVKAIDKLIALIKKLDMEMINWINSHNGAVNVNFVKRNDVQLNFLNDELEMISVCEDMDSVINSAKVDDESHVVETVSDKENNTTDNEIVTKDTNTVTNKDNDAPVKEITQEEQPEPEFVKPQPVRRLSSSSKVSNTSPRASRDDDSSDDEPADGGGNSYYDHHDDDDALSLFAESISGFESIRPSVVSAPVSRPVEEYVPRPVNKNIVFNIEKPVYCPTKIRETSETVTSKTICEKQNADSTSIYKQSNSTDGAESDQDFAENIDLDTRPVAPDTMRTPRLMESFFEGMPKARSVVFGNVCFYNLLNACRKVFYGQCMFIHMIPSCEQIKAKLTLLDEMMLIKEYLLVRNWVELRRRYGMCFVEECARRGLTRILVEMAYDFIVKARCDSEEDTRLRVNTIEITLLHLNNVDLSICEDLLKLVVATDKTNRTLLCDVFMATMSITQNFSRFKIVFLNLIHFMVKNDRTFNKDVVEHILERVCILAFEESVARALIQMMRLTNADIFNNSMIRLFEKQISVNKDVYEEYTLLKNRCAFTAMLASSVVESPSLLEDLALSGRSDMGDEMSAAHSDRGDGQVSALDKSDDQRATGVERGVGQCAARSDLDDGPPSVQSDNSDGQPPAPSPDTTNLDKMNKSLDEPAAPIITRTIGMNPPIVFSRVPTSTGTSQVHEASDATHESPSRSHMFTSDDTVAVNYGTWRNRSIFPRLPLPRIDQPVMRAPSWTPMRPRMRLPFRRPFNQRLVTFRTPSNIVRRPGPKY